MDNTTKHQYIQPNLLHLLQTAEGIRQANQPDWFQLVGLIHDMGKIMFLWGTGEDGQDGYSPFGQQWSLGGDTFVVGCRIPDDAVILPQYNILNPDMSNPAYNTEYGMYEAHCGLDSLKFAWGHDEYMYQMLIANDCSIPKVGLDMIRYHSAYPWHDKVRYFECLFVFTLCVVYTTCYPTFCRIVVVVSIECLSSPNETG
jgi:inositol oxygenase